MYLNWNEITALFGGSFDPPHIAHRQAVKDLLKNPGVRRIFVLPAANSHLKKNSAPINHRLAMTQICFSSVPSDPHYPESDIIIDTREIIREAKNPGQPTYTLDTLMEFRQEFGPIAHLKIAFTLGADQLPVFDQWHRFPEILSFSHWLVLERKPDGPTTARETLKAWEQSGLVSNISTSDGLWHIKNGKTYLKLITTQAPPLSSTLIRENIARSGSAPAGTLLPEIEEYLKQHGLYGTEGKDYEAKPVRKNP